MTRSNTAIFILLITLFASSGVAQSAEVLEELKACTRLTDRDTRLACFDNLGERVLREEPAEKQQTQGKMAQSEAESRTSTDAKPLPDNYGKANPSQYDGLITSCKKGQSDRWFFIFDNGQVWKQVNKRNLRLKECHFNATITQDMFGYKLRIDDVDKTIRVRRER